MSAVSVLPLSRRSASAQGSLRLTSWAALDQCFDFGQRSSRSSKRSNLSHEDLITSRFEVLVNAIHDADIAEAALAAARLAVARVDRRIEMVEFADESAAAWGSTNPAIDLIARRADEESGRAEAIRNHASLHDLPVEGRPPVIGTDLSVPDAWSYSSMQSLPTGVEIPRDLQRALRAVSAYPRVSELYHSAVSAAAQRARGEAAVFAGLALVLSSLEAVALDRGEYHAWAALRSAVGPVLESPESGESWQSVLPVVAEHVALIVKGASARSGKIAAARINTVVTNLLRSADADLIHAAAELCQGSEFLSLQRLGATVATSL